MTTIATAPIPTPHARISPGSRGPARANNGGGVRICIHHCRRAIGEFARGNAFMPWEGRRTLARMIMPVIHAWTNSDILALVQVSTLGRGRHRCASAVAGMRTVKQECNCAAIHECSIHACRNSSMHPGNATVYSHARVRAGAARNTWEKSYMGNCHTWEKEDVRYVGKHQRG